MFERFSMEARSAVVDAQTVAREAGSAAIDTRHVLVALAGSPGPAADGLRGAGLDPATVSRTVRDEVRAGDLDAEVLASLGIDLESVRRETDATFGRGALDRAGRAPRQGHVPFTPEARKALRLALREAAPTGRQEHRRRPPPARDPAHRLPRRAVVGAGAARCGRRRGHAARRGRAAGPGSMRPGRTIRAWSPG